MKNKKIALKFLSLVIFFMALVAFDKSNFSANAYCQCFIRVNDENKLVTWDNAISDGNSASCRTFCGGQGATQYGDNEDVTSTTGITSGVATLTGGYCCYDSSSNSCAPKTGNSCYGGVNIKGVACEITSCKNAIGGGTTGSVGGASPTPPMMPSHTPSGTTTPGAATTVGVSFDNPLAFNTVEGLLNSIMGNLQGIVATLAVLVIVIGGILYVTSAGDEGRMKTAKAAITYAMIGLAVAILAPSFLKEISIILGWEEGSGGAAKTISEIAMDILKFLLGAIGALALLMLVVGGITYTTSAGDEDRVDMGKNMVKYSIIGLIVALLSLAIVRQIAEVLIQ